MCPKWGTSFVKHSMGGTGRVWNAQKQKFFLRSFNTFRIRRRRQWRQWISSIRRRGDRIIKRCNYVLFIFIYCTLYGMRACSGFQQFHWFIVDKFPKLFTRLSTLSHRRAAPSRADWRLAVNGQTVKRPVETHQYH